MYLDYELCPSCGHEKPLYGTCWNEKCEDPVGEEQDEPLCYDWCGLGMGLCLRPLGHDDDCSPYPDVT